MTLYIYIYLFIHLFIHLFVYIVYTYTYIYIYVYMWGILESSRREGAHSPSVRKGYQHSIPLAANQLDTQAASGNPISHWFISSCFTLLSYYWKLPSFVRYWFCTSDFAMRMLGRWKTISRPWGHGERLPPGVRDANEWQSKMIL